MIEEKDIKTVLNKNISLYNLITEPADEINEGSKIKNWIEKIWDEKDQIITDLKF